MRLLALSFIVFIFEACMLFSAVKSEEITAEERQDSGVSIFPSFISSWLYGDDEPSAEVERRPRHAQRQRGGGPMPPFRRPIVSSYMGRSFPQQRPFSAAAVAAPSHRVNRQVVTPAQRLPARPLGGPGRVTPPLSLKGWVSYPTPRPLMVTPGNKRPVRSGPGKNGVCGAPASYGIECSANMDQCSTDAGCPGNTMCCIVASCGQMCVAVSPKAGSSANGQQSLSASSVIKKQVKRENEPESSTMSSGLKQTDVIKNVHRKASVNKKRSPSRNLRYIRGFNPAMRNRTPPFRFRG